MRNWLSLGVGLLVLAAGLSACGGGEEEEEGLNLPANVSCTGTIPGFAEVTGFTKCVTCHDSMKTGSARQAAPPDINFDTYASAKANAEKAASEVNGGDMPPKDSMVAPMTDAEKQVLFKWALCGTPETSSGGTTDAGGGDGG